MSRTTEILDQLNAYDQGTGDNIWQDVILGLDEYDEAATNALNQSSSDRFVLTDGTMIAWTGQTIDADPAGRWHKV
jgi:hypothetical protein